MDSVAALDTAARGRLWLSVNKAQNLPYVSKA